MPNNKASKVLSLNNQQRRQENSRIKVSKFFGKNLPTTSSKALNKLGLDGGKHRKSHRKTRRHNTRRTTRKNRRN
jgi:hypothetical protein